MKQTSLALAITALLSTQPSALVQASEGCAPLTGKESGIDIGRSSTERCLPGTNSFQYQQWGLLNSGQDAFSHHGGVAGNDLNLWWAHRLGVLGQGINVAVVDDGLAIRHPDLEDNIHPGSRNVVTGSEDPTPAEPKDGHGTAVAGIIAAVDNAIGTKGVAPSAQLQGFNLLAKASRQLQLDWLYALGNSYASRNIRVFNQSYGQSITRPIPVSPNQNQLDGLFGQQTLTAGAAYIKAAGNGFNSISRGDYSYMRRNNPFALPFENSNLDPANSNFWNLVVSAINANGVRASYSSVGSSVFLSAPGGEDGIDAPAIVTTDLPGCERGYHHDLELPLGDRTRENRLHALNGKLDPHCDYNAIMNGTSAATPHVSGAMALLMSAYPNMSVRDLRDVLARSATRIDAAQAPVMIRYTSSTGQRRNVKGLEGWERNFAGMWYSPTYGFGLVDVNKALSLAADHIPLPPLVQLPWQEVVVKDPADPEIGAIPNAGAHPTSSTTLIDEPLTVEAVQVMVSLDHQRLPDLLIELVSPSGTRSILLNPFNSLIGQTLDREEFGYTLTTGIRDMRMLSHKFYGESAQGEWRLEVTDVAKDDRQVYKFDETTEELTVVTEINSRQPGQLISWSLRVLGHDANRS
ncbi:S8 family serine peptidase [Aeromonas sp. MdU4]|uniref:serine protease Asp n=1 Tax=Aeromonas sp. MdU4 TaxID=3342819 RepID=UPI0035B99CC0